MIAEFNNIKDAQALCDKIHNHLQENCKGYNATKWQDPLKAEKEESYCVSLPQEFDKPVYDEKIKVFDVVKTLTDKAIELTVELPSKFIPVEITLDEKIIKE